MPQENLIDQMMDHQSIRKFTDQGVSQEIINTCIKAGQTAASSSFVQVASIIQVSSKQS